MPYKVQKKSGSRPWKIIANGKVVGSSATKSSAEASVRARHASEKKGGNKR